MIFPILTLETTVQVEDKLRLDASKTFVPTGEDVTDIEIQPESTEAFISVFNDDNDKWYLDWAYATDGAKDVVVRVTTAVETKSKTYQLDSLTVDDDALFSFDNDMYPYEPRIDLYLPPGKSSFIYAHRAAQKKILAYLDEQRIWKKNNERYTKQDIVDKEEFNRWSLFQAMLIIFEGSQVSKDDIFQEKRQEYENEMRQARNRSTLRLDADGDGEVELYNIRSARFIRR